MLVSVFAKNEMESRVAIGDGVSALATLGVTFGGFSPTAMDGVEASKRYIEMVQALEAERKEAKRRIRELEFARTSKPAVFEDESGSRWTYVVVDKKLVRIVSCESECSRLDIPDMIEGMPVYEISSDACSRNDFVEEINCPDTIESIGSCAFRYCQNLRKVRFPASVNEYSASWLSHSMKVEELVLPGNLEVLNSDVFDSPSLKSLVIGNRVRVIEPGAFQKTMLSRVSIHADNPFLRSDGVGIYSVDGKRFITLARRIESYAVSEGCETICKKAAYNFECLKRIKLPSSVTVLEDFAFSHSGIEFFDAPSALDTISEKAFFRCASLREVRLNEGLKSVGASAFEESGISELVYPSTIESIGRSATYHTDVVHSGDECSLKIDESCKSLFLDGKGGLYRHEQDGPHLIQLIDFDLEEYIVNDGTTVIDEYAFAHNKKIRRVIVPEGVLVIKKSAFRCCGGLVQIELPDSLETIEEDAFLDTSLESIRIPAKLETLGKNALVTAGAHHGDQKPSLAHVEVVSDNKRFYVDSGMLFRRNGEKSSVVIFTSSASHVVFPKEVDRVESYAFNNAHGIQYLELNPGLKIIENLGLTTWCWIELIHIELSEPLEGRTVFEFRFPNTMKGVHGISMGIGGASWVNVPGIMAQYDNTLVQAHDYNSPKNPDSIPIYDQVKMVLARLDDPILLAPVNRNMYDRLLHNYIDEICVDVARHDDRAIMESLIELGYVHEGNLESIIEGVSRLQDAAMTGYLLEVKRRRFNRAVIDFDL